MSAEIRVARTTDSQEISGLDGSSWRYLPGVAVNIQYRPGAGADALAELDRLVAEVRRDVEECP